MGDADSPLRSSGADAAPLIRAFARPRLTGSSGAAAVERKLRARLETLGYGVESLPFEFSAWPAGRGVSVLAFILLAGASGAWWLLSQAGTRAGEAAGVAGGTTAGAALGALGVVLATAAVALVGLGATSWAILNLPFGRITGHNWLARRSHRPPTLLVMAHRDSKSQAVPTLVRTLAAGLAILGWLGLLVASLFGVFGAPQPWLAHAGLAAALAGGFGLLPAVTGNTSPGALDNATGLAALLLVARDQREHDDVAFLITDAEEFGLAGAAAAVGKPPLDGVRIVINMDGLDDVGMIRVCEGRGFPTRDRAPGLTAVLARSCGQLGLPVQTGPLPPGVLCDHIPFAAAGVPAVTLMRGDLRSLARVHRPSDAPQRLTGAGAEETARVVARALDEIRRLGLPPLSDTTTLGAS
ncbi:MAG: M28 family peptidase [Gemmatimonadota bacterium]